MVALHVAALVEGGHGLVGRPRLDLHEEGLLVRALGARRLSRVHVLPRGRAAQHVVDLEDKRGLASRMAGWETFASVLSRGV